MAVSITVLSHRYIAPIYLTAISGQSQTPSRYNLVSMYGFIDYTLAKRAVLTEVRRGGLDRLDVCDAHPQLLRAATNIGAKIDRPCPVCTHDTLREVRFVYGDDLKHLSGRPVYPQQWAEELATNHDEFRCYSIEVCVDCSWNHLVACYLMGRRFSQKSRQPSRARRAKGAGLS